jgi:hypothetical protein
VVLIVTVLCPSPAFAKPPPGVPHDTAGGPHFVRLEAGTPVSVPGLSKPGNRPCPDCVTYAVVRVPNGDVVTLPRNAIDYETQTVRVSEMAFGPYTSEDLKEFLWLPSTGGAALLPLLGAAMLVGGALVLRRLLR